MTVNPAFLALGAANPGLLPLAFVNLGGETYGTPEGPQWEPTLWVIGLCLVAALGCYLGLRL